MFIGIDQSYTSTGVVIIDNDGNLNDFMIIKSDPSKSIYNRAIDITDTITKLVKDTVPQLVAIEGLAFGKFGNATRDLAGLQFMIVASLIRHNNQYMIVTPNSLKKTALGIGRGSKADIIASLPESVKQTMITKGYKKTKGLADLADAYWLARIGWSKLIC